jgi:hypothetical protein
MEPELRAGAERSSESVRSLRSNTPLALDNFIDQTGRAAKNFGEISLCPTPRIQFFTEKLSGWKYFYWSHCYRFSPHAIG